MSRCITCNHKSAAIVGFCKYCNNNFCLKHRLPESHQCINMNILCKQEYDKNSEKLMQEKLKKVFINI
jgi:predicted nucleic acid binding AN1-type Zn finger protein